MPDDTAKAEADAAAAEATKTAHEQQKAYEAQLIQATNIAKAEADVAAGAEAIKAAGEAIHEP